MPTPRISEESLKEFVSDYPNSKFAIAIPIAVGIRPNSDHVLVFLDGDFKLYKMRDYLRDILSCDKNNTFLVLPLVPGKVSIKPFDTHPCATIDLSDGRVFDSVCPACKLYLDCNVNGDIQNGMFNRWNSICVKFDSM